eukprot:gnl/TRDRNA2_/TRDRNA2_128930_c0_seq2.p1 gnl/TRDRNA2_/TRDRNA2_128930_c0~~gnl/TRDRNA2_/TRDRNA2_128930_c0_seq2.p1  ORF type:complete len:335 (+),score=8.90 gnl/TRDRNA2_/TRDRNA2_128930_c0_seq2:20-1024(+)
MHMIFSILGFGGPLLYLCLLWRQSLLKLRYAFGGQHGCPTTVLTYPKTGTSFMTEFLTQCGGMYLGNTSSYDLFSPIQSDFAYHPLTKPLFSGEHWAFSPDLRYAHPLFLILIPAVTWPLPSSFSENCPANTLHWFRDPVDVIVSGYRYLTTPDEAWLAFNEPWVTHPGKCWVCTEASRRELFLNCDGCTFLELLRASSAEKGIQLLARGMEESLHSMIGNLERWANHTNVLHLSVDFVKGRQRDQLFQCIGRFVGSAPVSAYELDRMTANPGHSKSVDGNLRNTDKFDNTGLRTQLSQHPVWGPLSTKVKTLAAAIFARQHEQYGCPRELKRQ